VEAAGALVHADVEAVTEWQDRMLLIIQLMPRLQTGVQEGKNNGVLTFINFEDFDNAVNRKVMQAE
jgi:hypothetical protein